MTSIYADGEYLAEHPGWHTEDSAWKASRILEMIRRNKLELGTIADIGCGAGHVLAHLQRQLNRESIDYFGFDISPQAIELAQPRSNAHLTFEVRDLLQTDHQPFDALLVVDVFEHVPDYMGFVTQCGRQAKYKIYHIPLDLHVSSVFRNQFIKGRASLGHLHYFSAESALATIKDCNQRVIDFTYTNAALDLFSTHPSFRKALANLPRWVMSKFSIAITARLLGGYSLLVLAE